MESPSAEAEKGKLVVGSAPGNRPGEGREESAAEKPKTGGAGAAVESTKQARAGILLFPDLFFKKLN